MQFSTRLPCIDPNLVVAWFDGALDPKSRAEIEEHVDACDECRALLVELGREIVQEEDLSGEGSVLAPLTIGARIGRYVVLEWLGAGGMGVVYGAYDPELERRIAIKFLRPDRAPEGGDPEGVQERLLREGQALARVSHPNVIAVHDVGTHGGLVFVAMEYVGGGTLAAWLARPGHSWSSIVAHFVDAGRGLAAAHAVGLVHRDFKPSNVLLGNGRVRVVDFGLARAASVENGSADEALVVGTPRYMSPEQRSGGVVDARSDQYAFSVALYEALFGELPTADSASRARVPAHVRAALNRGLAERPADRFPSMEMLLSALSRDPRALWWRAAAVAAACALLGSVLILRAGRAPVAAVPCRGAERKLAGVWDEERRQLVTSAFASTKTIYGASVAREVTRVVDVYVRRWLSMHTAACEATRVHGEQSEELMDLRIACLDDQLRDLRALSDLFAKADDEIVQKAVQAAYGLHGLEACADITTLQARVRPPDESVRAEVLRLREGVSRASALDGAGKYAAAEDAAESLRQAAKATRYAPIEAEVEYWVGRARAQRGKDMAGGIASLYASVDAAEAGRDDVAKARALVQLTFTLGERQARYDEAERAGRLASAVLTRLPSEIELRAKVDDDLGFIEVARGRYAEGVARSQRALKLREEAFGPDDYRVAVSLSNTSKSLYRMGRTEQALAYQKRAASILSRALGETHPLYALALNNMAISELSARLDDDALRDALRALTIWSDGLGREHRNLVQAEGVVASILTDLGRFAEALPHAERSLALAEAVLPPDHPNTVSALNTVGKVQLGLSRTNDAVATQERALAMCKRMSTPPYETAETMSELGEAYLAAGRPAAARPLLEQAVALRAAQETDPLSLAESRLLLARALGTSKRATELAEQARDAYKTSPRSAPERAAAEAWLAAHR